MDIVGVEGTKRIPPGSIHRCRQMKRKGTVVNNPKSNSTNSFAVVSFDGNRFTESTIGHFFFNIRLEISFSNIMHTTLLYF